MDIKKYTLEYDIDVFYVTAKNFPHGINAAFKKLDSYVPFTPDRKFFGLSRPEEGKIIYKAAAEELRKGESKKFNCESLVIPKGQYVTITVKDFRDNTSAMKSAFQELMSNPEIAPDTYCLEWYDANDRDVRCMIRLNN